MSAPYAWRRVIVHHSAGRDHPELPNWKSIERFHVTPDDPATPVIEGRGWKAIGYHALVEQIDGRYVCVPGRPTSMEGSHCFGQNRIALGICFVGNFNDQPPPRTALVVGAEQVAEWILDWPLLTTAEIWPHRRYKRTDCPGHTFPLDEFRELVMEILANG